MKDLLPIGSVVLLKEAKKSLMIIGTTQIDDSGVKYDYISCVFPEGYINSELFFLFNNEDIEDVKFIGYVNAESQALAQAMRLEENKQKEKAGEENG